MYTLKDFENVVKEKFIDNKVLDYTGELTETETVKTFIKNIKAEGIVIENLKDIPQLFYLIRYSEDSFNLKYIYNETKETDAMQTARMTLLTLRGDCEDIHRLFNVAALNFVEKNAPKLLILFFGDETEIIGGHATALIESGDQYINLDYNFYTYANSLNGILSYLSDAYFNVYSYVILEIEDIKDKLNYRVAKSGYFTQRAEYIPQYIPVKADTAKLRKHLYRSGEFQDNLLKYAGIAAGIIAGIMILR